MVDIGDLLVQFPMNAIEFEEKIKSIKKVEPDMIDKLMINEASEINDGTVLELEKYKEMLEFMVNL